MQKPCKQAKLYVRKVLQEITDDNGKIIVVCVAKMYCWNVAYIDTLLVDEKYRDKGLGSKMLAEVEKTAIKKVVT